MELEKELANVREERDKFKRLAEDHEQALKAAKEEHKSTSEKLEQRDAELAEAKSKVDEHEARLAVEQRKSDVYAELKDAKLNPEDEQLVSKAFVETLISIADKEERSALIQDRASLLQRVSESESPISQERSKPKSGDQFDCSKTLESVAFAGT